MHHDVIYVDAGGRVTQSPYPTHWGAERTVISDAIVSGRVTSSPVPVLYPELCRRAIRFVDHLCARAR
jgi:hypothetical protein